MLMQYSSRRKCYRTLFYAKFTNKNQIIRGLNCERFYIRNFNDMFCLFFIEMRKNIFLLLVTLAISGMCVLLYMMKGKIKTEDIQQQPDYVPRESIELTIRMTLSKSLIYHFSCNLLRSAVLFWNPKYGDVVIILDKEDQGKHFSKKLNSLRLPFRFRLVYEDPPNKIPEFIKIGQAGGHTLGVMRMLYSSFLMDMYTDAPIIAWIDTDGMFTMPVVEESIIKNGKLVVKGMNTFNIFVRVRHWDHSTNDSLGLPMVSDFMTYFPVYVYSSTIKNCREYMMKRLRAHTFEDAFLKIPPRMVSPVSIIMSYAYYFEKERYEWHIDTGKDSLSTYNKQHLPKHPLLKIDVSPELHVAIHAAYYVSKVNPLEKVICYSQMYLGMTNLSHCRSHHLPNMILFEFHNSPLENHFESWCGGKSGHILCTKMIRERYNVFVHLYKTNRISIKTNHLEVIEKFAKEEYQAVCPTITYVPFP